MTYGGTVPTPTFTISGFVNGDTSAVVSGTPTLTPGATSASPVGTYSINVTQGSLAATNYVFPNLVDGTLTVNQAPTHGHGRQPVDDLRWHSPDPDLHNQRVRQ